jgi:hypothetical protein
MVTTKDFFEHIESFDFTALLHRAGDVETYISVIESSSCVEDLLRFLRDEDSEYFLFDRLLRLSEELVDIRCPHLHDDAMAVYLWLLAKTDSSLTKDALEIVDGLTCSPNSQKLAEYLRAKNPKWHSYI